MRVAMMVLIGLSSTAWADRAFDPNTPSPSPGPPKQEPLCFLGRPQQFCGSVFVLEIGYALGKTTAGEQEGSAIIPLQGGLLVNLTKHNAIGATAGYVWLEQFDADSKKRKFDGSFGAFVRYRRWLYDYFSADLSVGASSGGVIGEVALQVGDVLAFTGGVHQVKIEDRNELAYTFGVKIGAVLVGTAARLAIH